MGLGRNLLSATCAFALVSCGGGGSSSAPPTGGGGTPTPTPTTGACSLSARQDFAFAVLDEWYLFPDLIDDADQIACEGIDRTDDSGYRRLDAAEDGRHQLVACRDRCKISDTGPVVDLALQYGSLQLHLAGLVAVFLYDPGGS